MNVTRTPKLKWVARATRLCRPATGRTEGEGRWHWQPTHEEVRALSPFRAAGRRSAQASGLCYPLAWPPLLRNSGLRIFVGLAGVSLMLLGHAPSCVAEAEADFQNGLAACRAGQFTAAAEAFQKSAAQKPAAGTLLNLGLARWRQGRAGEAMADWEQAAWLDPFQPEAPNNLRFARNVAQVDAPDLRWHEVASTWLPAKTWAGIASFSLWLASLANIQYLARENQPSVLLLRLREKDILNVLSGKRAK